MFTPEVITCGSSSLTVIPERGGIVTSLCLGGIELLYQDMLAETLMDMTKSVRGGIPILFPNAGFLTEVEKERSRYTLPQHGFARTTPWRAQRAIGGTSIYSQQLFSSDVVDMYGYEWKGAITNTITLSERVCFFEYEIENLGSSSLPVSLGLHPYFSIPYGRKSDIVWNFPGGEEIRSQLDIWENGETLHIDIPENGVISVEIPGIGKITLEVSQAFKRLWIWSLPGKDFVCIEPVYGDDGAILQDPWMIDPCSTHQSSLKITLSKES